ncbi:MAG TPA: HNH endonuclease signature motif containing protein, partial [Streptosporangiaceae bacterium]
MQGRASAPPAAPGSAGLAGALLADPGAWDAPAPAGWDAVPPWDTVPPTEEELCGLPPDPYSGPPDGADAWAADVPASLLIDCLTATEPAVVPEALPAGVLPRDGGRGAGFAAGGAADGLPPGVALAGFASDAWATGLDRVTDDQLIGVLRAWRRLTSWTAAGELAAVAELSRRRAAQVTAGADPHLAEHVGDELAVSLTLTARAADQLLDFAARLDRLPRTRAALAAGEIDRARAHVVADEVSCLGHAHAAAVEAAVIGPAPGQTTGQLRASARRAALAADPGAAGRHREEAEKEARVEVWSEPSGTAALAGRDLRPADVIAADKRIDSLARQLKAAGIEGSLGQLRARAYVALLLGPPMASPLLGYPTPSPQASGSTPGAAGAVNPPAASSNPAAGVVNSAAGSSDPAAGSINLIMPLSSFLGASGEPGEVAGFGPVAAADGRALADRLAGERGSRWCLTLTGQDGRAVAHGCASARRNGRGRPAGGGWELTVTIRPLAARCCLHERESAGYQPSPALRHVIRIRQRTCSFPGCRRPSARCDQDHTVPHDQGGRTCECNLAPLCR